jgi:hypothetical protein
MVFHENLQILGGLYGTVDGMVVEPFLMRLQGFEGEIRHEFAAPG